MTNAIQSINSQHTHRQTHTEHKLPAERKTIWSGPRGESKKQTEFNLSSGVTFGIWDPDHPSDCWSSPACSSSMRFREFDGSAGPPRHPQQRLKGAWINKSTTCRGDDADLQAAVTKTREKMPLIGADMTLLGLIRARPLIAGRVMRNFGPVDSDISESPIRYSDSKRTPVRHR